MADPKPFTPNQERVANVFLKAMSVANIALFRWTGGRLGAKFFGGAPVCLVTTVGRRSGAPRTSPLIYLADGDDLAIVASKGGMANHPLWYLNLEANPDVEVEIGSEKRPMRARTATDEERARLWPGLTAIYPDYDVYQARTDRKIPVVILSPR